MINEERVIIKGDINIGATIAYQDKNEKRPLVLLIMGTGSLDRDGNGVGMKSNIYKDLSNMFVDLGYVCIRYDKRGTHESTGNAKTNGLFDLVDDATSVIHYAKSLDYVDKEKIVVCGHSEGGMIATLLTKTEDLKGVILLAGTGVSLKDAMLYQNYLVLDEVQNMKGILGWFLRKKINKEVIDTQVEDLYKKAEESTKERMFYRGAMFSTKYFKEHGSLTKEDYLQMLKEYKGKILAITGKSDIQVDYRTLEPLSSLEDVTVYTPEKVNHLLREEDKPVSILNLKREYKVLLKKPISPKIKDSIKDWSSKL